MKVIWIVLIAYIFAIIAPGNSLPLRYPMKADISPVMPLPSVNHRLEGNTDDFTGTGPYAASGKQHSDTPCGDTQKGIVDNNLGKHPSKKVAHLLRSRPSLLASFHKELKDASHHSSKVRDAHLYGLPKPIHEKNISPVFSSVSVEQRPGRTTDDLTETDSFANGKPSYNPLSRGTQKGIKIKYLFTSPDLNKLLKNINLGKHLSKKVAHLLKSRPDLVASLSKALQDVGHRSSKVGHAQLNGSAMSVQETTVKVNNQIPETDDDQVLKERPELIGAGTMSHKTSNPNNQEILSKASLKYKKVEKQVRPTKEPSTGKKLDSIKLSREWDSEPDDVDHESEKHKLSGSDIDLGSGESEDVKPESEGDKGTASDTNWDSDATENMDPVSETEELSHSDTDWDYSTPEHFEVEAHTEEQSGYDINWNSHTTEGLNTVSDRDWKSGVPEDMDLKQGNDELLGSKDKQQEAQIKEQSRTDSYWEANVPEDMDLESKKVEEPSGSDIDWHSGVQEGNSLPLRNAMEADISPVMPSLNHRPVGTTNDFTGTDPYAASGKQHSNNPSGNTQKGIVDINLGKHPSKKVAHLLRSRPSLVASFHKELKDASHHSSKVGGTHINGLPKSIHEENISPVFSSVSVEQRPGRTTDDFTETGSFANDKPPYNPLSRGTQKGIKNKYLFTSPDLNKLLKNINLGKHLSKKVAQFLKSRPDLVASLSKALQDIGHRSSKVGHAQLNGSAMSVQKTTVKVNNQIPETDDDQVLIERPELIGAGTMSHKTSNPDNQEILSKASLKYKKVEKQVRPTKEPSTGKKLDSIKLSREWDSEPDDMNHESEKDKLSGSDINWGSGESEDVKPESKGHKRTASDTKWDYDATENMNPTSDTEELSESNNDWDYSAPEHMDVEADTEEQSGYDIDWISHTTERLDTESDRGRKSGVPEDRDLKLENDELSGSKDMKQGAQAKEKPGINTDRDSGMPKHMELESDKDELTGSDTERHFRAQKSYGSKTETEYNKKADTDMKLTLERLLRKSRSKILRPISTGAEGTASKDEIARSSPKGKKYASGVTKDIQLDNSETESSTEQFSAPVSDIRWSGTSLADKYSFDGVPVEDEGRGAKKQNEGGTTVIILGGIFFLLLLVAFCVYVWPIRKYYKEKCKRLKRDVEAARDNNERLSTRADSRRRTDCQSTPYYLSLQPRKWGRSPTPYGTPVVGSLVVSTQEDGYGQASYNGVPEAAQGQKSMFDVLIDDWLRDARNVERRKIIKRQTSQRRHSLSDSLLLAKSVINGCAKNKQFEEKASERRRVIKCSGSPFASASGKRRRSFAEELQAARSVIIPTRDYKESLEKAKEKCRTIKDTFAGKRRPSLLEEIGVAKDVIVDSERRKCMYELPPAVVEEMLMAHMAHGGPIKDYGDLLNNLIKENSEMKKMRTSSNTPPTAAAEPQSMAGYEALWNDDR